MRVHDLCFKVHALIQGFWVLCVAISGLREARILNPAQPTLL